MTMTAEQYIERVIDAMPRTTPLRTQIAMELRGHIAERVNNGQPLADVITQLGDPDKLAESYLAAEPLIAGNPFRRLAAAAGHGHHDESELSGQSQSKHEGENLRCTRQQGGAPVAPARARIPEVCRHFHDDTFRSAAASSGCFVLAIQERLKRTCVAIRRPI